MIFAWPEAQHLCMSQIDVVMVRQLQKSYAGRRVVDGVDLDVAAGEILGLIGANGAGKTTTVECVQGLRRPDAGTIRVLGLDPVAERDRLQGLVGSQLQSSALPDRLRVGEAVHLFGGRDGKELLDQFGLSSRWRSAFASLSGGERQRLFLVLALINRPRLLILDELTQGLDPAGRRGVWAAIDQLRGDGTTVLLVTHELDEAEQLCDRVVAMRAGRVLDTGRPAELVDRHGPAALVAFTLPAGWFPEVMADRLRRLPGVRAVAIDAGKVTIRGDRTAIAHVGATLVTAGCAPPDLSVRIPSLEDALVGLLERDDSDLPKDLAALDLAVGDQIGALR
jgi:ABC-2 type transport system ATP-binding protein